MNCKNVNNPNWQGGGGGEPVGYIKAWLVYTCKGRILFADSIS